MIMAYTMVYIFACVAKFELIERLLYMSTTTTSMSNFAIHPSLVTAYKTCVTYTDKNLILHAHYNPCFSVLYGNVSNNIFSILHNSLQCVH